MYEESLSLIPFLQHEDISSSEAFLQAALRHIVASIASVYRAAVYCQDESATVITRAQAQAADAPTELATPSSFLSTLQAGIPGLDEARHQIYAPLRAQGEEYGLLVLMYDGDAPTLPRVIDLASQLAFGLQHLEMQRTRDHATAMMRTFNDWILQSNQERDERAVLTKAAAILRDATNSHKVAIALLVDRQAEPYFAVEAALPQEYVGATLLDSERAVIRMFTENQEALIVDTTQDNPHLPQVLVSHLESLDTPTIVVFPMFDAQNTLLGIVALAFQQNRLRDEMMGMAQTIVAQLTMNLQKSRLLRETQNQAAQMQRLTTFSEAMQASLHTPELLAILLERLPYLLPVDYAAVLLYDRKAEGLRVAALSQQGENSVATPGTLLEPESNTIAEHTWKTQEALWINALQDTWTWQHPFISHLQTILAAPLTSNGVRIGVLEIGSEHSNQYSQTDMVAFEQVSSQLAVGLANAEAYAHSQQVARNKMLANDIVAQLQRQMEVEDILRITASELGQALGASRARIRLGYDTRKKGENDS